MKVMDKQLISRLKSIFDNIAHKTEEGTEFWFARELQDVLGYTEWRNFNTVIGKAKAACETTKRTIDNDFVDVNKIVSFCRCRQIISHAKWRLSRNWKLSGGDVFTKLSKPYIELFYQKLNTMPTTSSGCFFPEISI